MQYYQVVQGILSIPTNVLFKQQVCWFLKSVFLCKVSTVVVWIFQFLEFLGSGDWFFWWSLYFPAGDSNSRGWNSNFNWIWLVVWKIFYFSISYYGMSSETHWRTHMFQDGHIAPPGIVVDMGWDGCGNAEISRSRWLKPKRNGAVAATCGRSQYRDAATRSSPGDAMAMD